MSDIKQRAIEEHKNLRGKLDINPKCRVKNRDDLSLYYTPGVGAVSQFVAENPNEARNYTGLNNSVAIVSDGSAVLGLGNIGPHAALPVMEGKAMLFKEFAGIDGYPIVLDVQSADEIVSAVKAIAPSFGGINLEDIAAPICFEVEYRLKNELDIPVMHDDQHGTAIVVLAGLINALKLKNADIKDQKIVIVGSGAAGVAIARLLYGYGALSMVVVDSIGIVSADRNDLNETKKQLLEFTNKDSISGSLSDVLNGADVFIGVSKAGLLTQDMIRSMNSDPVIFAMANPDPEILPDQAKEAGAFVVATGRSDFPNQVNNALAFPGIFRGALDHQVKTITDDHKIAAARAIAGLVENPTQDIIIPDIFDERVVKQVAKVFE